MEDAEETSKNPGPIAPVVTRGETEAVIIRARWERTQKDLDRERLSRRAESEQTAIRLAELQNSLNNTTNALERARTPATGRKTIPLIISACVAVTLAAGALSFYAFARHPVSSAEQVIVPPSRRPAASLREHAPQGSFSSAASRLSEALGSVPGRSPEQIFREVNAKSPGSPLCPIEWSGDQPAVVFGSGQSQPLSLDASLGRCADAVEHLSR